GVFPGAPVLFPKGPGLPGPDAVGLRQTLFRWAVSLFWHLPNWTGPASAVVVPRPWQIFQAHYPVQRADCWSLPDRPAGRSMTLTRRHTERQYKQILPPHNPGHDSQQGGRTLPEGTTLPAR